MENNTPLDLVGMPIENNYTLASTGKRFGTFLIDYIITFIINVFIIYLIGITNELMPSLIGIVVYILYYFIMEYLFGRTIGKYICGTVVVRSEDLQKINLSQALGRTFSRLVPFEAFSLLGSQIGWHDKWNNTIVVEANSLVSGSN